MHANVDHLMQAGLGQWLEQQTAMRAAAREQAYSRWTWSAAILMPVLAFVWFGPESIATFRGFVALGGISAAIWWGYQPIAAAKHTIKIGINAAIAASHGVQYAHNVEPGAEFEGAKRFGLVPKHDRAEFEDHWYGALEGHAFNLYEAHLEERRGGGKNERWETVFRGVIIQMAFGRPFRSTTLLQRAGEHRKWFGLGGAKDSITIDGHQLDFVDQVHPAFAEVFGLFSDDQVEARVLVHPSYVEHLLKLERAFGAKELRALFITGQVIITVEGRNLFESGTMDATEDRLRVEEAAAQFAALAGLALAINQNERGRVLAEARAPVAPETRALDGEMIDAPIVQRPAGGFGRKRL
jgi:hypothetical protein